MKEYSNILDQIGNTPLVELQHLQKNKNVKVLVKLEGNNPGGSVKDRAAYNMIAEALKRGDIKQGDILVEATSGNTGIALAFIAQLMGLNMKLVMPENATQERISTMRFYGAELILTPQAEGIEGSRDLALKLRDEKGYHILNQFGNDDNWKAHYKTTGPEIWKDTDGEITHFVSAMGTTGTVMGVSTYLKEQNPTIQIIGTEPTEGSSIPGIRKWEPSYTPLFFDPERLDEVIPVSELVAKNTVKLLAQKEGLFVGISSGGAVATALQVASKLEQGVVVAIICDRGDRYLSSDFMKI
ncbi:cysteine synthase B [Lishizhenia tianjinensis]|uniref:Cysteine synthase n=1 Tax=Lishizhenia tianjinensis TaxID=477690 RepID=A0A1I6YDY9_9FLAO|nr:cysteine synthase CysM [Lishizhenia tianjinensis]SFT48527.1 cysteine synthase B [Lishizhenia tianjinensis]